MKFQKSSGALESSRACRTNTSLLHGRRDSGLFSETRLSRTGQVQTQHDRTDFSLAENAPFVQYFSVQP